MKGKILNQYQTPGQEPFHTWSPAKDEEAHNYLLRITSDFIKGEGQCRECKFNMWTGVEEQNHLELASPCQQCQNRILEKYFRSLDRGHHQ